MSVPRIEIMIIKINPESEIKISMALRKWYKQQDAKYQINRQLNQQCHPSIANQMNRNNNSIQYQYDECLSSSFSYHHIFLAISLNRPVYIILFAIIPLSLLIVMIKKFRGDSITYKTNAQIYFRCRVFNQVLVFL